MKVMHKIGNRYRRCNQAIVGKNNKPVASRFTPIKNRFSIEMNYSDVPLAYCDSEYMVWLEDMKNYFEQIVIGVSWLPNENITLRITVSFEQLPPNVLGQCGPGDGTFYNIPAYLGDLRFNHSNPLQATLATVRHATMKFSSDYYKVNPTNEVDRSWKRSFFSTAVHEGFHAFGFGSLWNGNFRIVTFLPVVNTPVLLTTVTGANIVGTGNPTNPQYTKSLALNAYRETMTGQSSVNSIPIENYGMSANTIMVDAGGTALAHWKGNISSSPSGIVNDKGQDLVDEIMTAWSNRDEGKNRWVSKFSVASLADIGWEVDYLPIEISLNEYRSI